MKTRKGLGRGLSALIPDADMEFLSRVARGAEAVPVLVTGGVATAGKTATPPGTTAIPASRTSRSPRRKNASANPVAQDAESSAGGEPSIPSTGESNLAPSLPQEEKVAPLAELVSLSQIEANPYQPRRNFSDEEMQELADSVKEHGVLQPVLLRPVDLDPLDAGRDDGAVPRYQLVAGERRWRASIAAGLNAIPAIIRRVSDQQALELAVIENVQRHDISALDAAIAYRRLVHEFSLSQEEVARRVGKSRVAITNTLRLLDLPQEVQKAIEEGILSEGHGRAILLAPGDGSRRAVFRRVIREKLSVRSTEELARSIQENEAEVPASTDDAPPSARQQPEVRRIEEGLQKHLGTRVHLRPRKRGGQMVIQYFSNEELERLLKLLMR